LESVDFLGSDLRSRCDSEERAVSREEA